MKKQFYYLANDTVFKYLFKNPKTRQFYEELIKYYTGLDISSFKLFDNELNSGNSYVDYRLDSLLVNEDKSIILNIEMNRVYKDYVDIRNRRYLHTIAGTSKDRKDYKNKRVVIQLNLNCYLSHENNNICNNTYMLRDKENDLEIEDFKIHNIYIPKEIEMCYNENIKKKLKLFMCESYEEMKDIVKEDKELKKIMDEIERLNQEKYFGALYNVEEEQKKLENSARITGYEEGINFGMNEGIKEGMNIKTQEIAKTMLENGSDVGYVSKCTGLTIEEVNNLYN